MTTFFTTLNIWYLATYIKVLIWLDHYEQFIFCSLTEIVHFSNLLWVGSICYLISVYYHCCLCFSVSRDKSAFLALIQANYKQRCINSYMEIVLPITSQHISCQYLSHSHHLLIYICFVDQINLCIEKLYYQNEKLKICRGSKWRY